jgi:hypothetical protein
MRAKCEELALSDVEVDKTVAVMTRADVSSSHAKLP